MNIILKNVTNIKQATEAFRSVEIAIEEDIKSGRNNWKTYYFGKGKHYHVVKNKNSFTVYYYYE